MSKFSYDILILIKNLINIEHLIGIKMQKFCYIIILIFTLSLSIFAQREQFKMNGGSIEGTVFDQSTKHTIEYANVVLLSIKDSSLINGTITNSDGIFTLTEVPFGKFLLEVRFIGYKTEKFDIQITPEKKSLNLGEIYIHPNALELNDVVVEGERSPVSYQIDKKVIDVDKIQTVISGNAADVLQNIPSVTVDIEGNVSLRGSANFTVLIDGKPSIISAQDALQQIPASSIQNIEIITNPSAKYDPEGSAGIINIILKKNQNVGLSGIINANVGLNNKYGGDFLFQYRTTDILYTFGMDYNQRTFPGTNKTSNTYFYNDVTSYLNSTGESEWDRNNFSIRGGLEFNTSAKDYFNFMARYGVRGGGQNSTSIYNNYTSVDPFPYLYKNVNTRNRDGDFAGGNLTYQHKFNPKGQELKGEFNFGYNNGDESTITESIRDGNYLEGKKTTEKGPSRSFETKIDYTLPIDESKKFEAGFQNRIGNSDEINELYELNTVTGEYEYQTQFSNSTKYENNDQAIYATYSQEIENFGFQGGLRGEYTYRTTTLINQNQSITIDRWDYFPTLHASYKFSKATQLMASYTRRIQRPRGWQLEPFYTWMNANNVRIGNPGLLPELIDSYEAGIQSFIGNVNFSFELYHRVTNNKIDRVRSVYDVNVNLDSAVNIGKDFSTGGEMMIIFDPVKFWNINLMANFYDYRIEGVIFDEPFERKSFNWSIRMNNMFKVGPNTQIQYNINYNSPGVSSQGTWEGFLTSDVSLRQDFFDKALSLTLQVRDLFRTAKHEFTSSGPDFSSYNYFESESPMVMLNARFNFNNFKAKRDRGDMENMNDSEDEF
jgi:outer membrane cobalamin receptor